MIPSPEFYFQFSTYERIHGNYSEVTPEEDAEWEKASLSVGSVHGRVLRLYWV